MAAKLSCLGVALAFFGFASTVLAQKAVSDPEVLKGIRQVEEGDYDAGIVTLDAAARRLAADQDRVWELSQAYLYLGIAYVGKGHEAAAKAKFREAVARIKELSLSPEEFPPKVIDLFEAAKQEASKEAAAPQPPPPPVATKKKGGGKTLLFVAAGGGAAAAAVAAGAGGGGESVPSPTSQTQAGYRVDGSDTRELPRHGSGGPPFQQQCPASSLVVGIVGQSDSFLRMLGARCAAVQADGSLGVETTLPVVGTSRGTSFDDRCPSGQVVVRVFGRTGPIAIGGGAFSEVVQQFGAGCAPLREWVGSGTLGQQLFPHGGSDGGSPFDDTCPQGYVVFGFFGGATGTANAAIDSIGATCVRVTR